jgi:hypothetical protein
MFLLFRSSDTNHSQTVNWLGREAAAGVTPTGAEINAANDYMRKVDAAGIRSKVRYRNLLATSGGATSAMIPLIDDDSTVPNPIVPIPVNFLSGDWTAAGVKGNGTSKYIDLDFAPATYGYTADNLHLMAAAKDLLVVSGINRTLFTCNGAAALPIIALRHHEPGVDVIKFFAQQSGTINGPSNPNAVPDLLIHASSVSTIDARVFATGVQIGATYTTARTTALPTLNMYALARNNNGVVGEWSLANLAAFGWGLGMTAADVAADYAALVSALALVGRTGF